MKQSTDAANVALVTGSSSGIGLACADRLAKAGCRVWGGSRRPVSGHAWRHVALDVTDEASVGAAVATVQAEAGRIDALVHCAGAGLAGPVEETATAAAHAHLDTNYFGAVRCIRAVLPVMRKQGRGRIVIVGSIGGLIGLPYQAHYSAGKFALDGLVEALRGEIAPFGVEATVLHPGDFNTAFGARRTVCEAVPGSAYDDAFRRHIEFYGSSEGAAPHPDRVAACVERLLLGRRPLPVRAIVGSPLERLGVIGKRLLPAGLFEIIVRKAYGPPRS